MITTKFRTNLAEINGDKLCPWVRNTTAIGYSDVLAWSKFIWGQADVSYRMHIYAGFIRIRDKIIVSYETICMYRIIQHNHLVHVRMNIVKIWRNGRGQCVRFVLLYVWPIIGEITARPSVFPRRTTPIKIQEMSHNERPWWKQKLWYAFAIQYLWEQKALARGTSR